MSPERIVKCVRCGEKVFDGKDLADPEIRKIVYR